MLTLALVPALLACARVERTVTDRSVMQEDGAPIRVLSWQSDRYPEHTVRSPGDACWDAAVVNEAVPDACLTVGTLAEEADPFQQAPWIAWPGTFLAMAALGLLAMKRVAWQREVQPVHRGGHSANPLDESVALMRSTEAERDTRRQSGHHDRDLRYPFLTGMLVVVPVLAVLVLLVGYGRTLQWGFLTGVLLFFAVAIPGVLVLLHLWRPSALDAAIRRMMFLGGASATLAVGSLLALLLRTPLLELHGVDWPG